MLKFRLLILVSIWVLLFYLPCNSSCICINFLLIFVLYTYHTFVYSDNVLHEKTKHFCFKSLICTYFYSIRKHCWKVHVQSIWIFYWIVYMYFIYRQMKRQKIMQLTKSGITSLLSCRLLLSRCFLIMSSYLVCKVWYYMQ